MPKRLIALVILISMVTHCAGRLGFLAYLYAQRHTIAVAIHLVDEKPLAVCGSNNFQPDANLVIQTTNADQSIPQQLLEVREVQLFFQNKVTDGLLGPSSLFLGNVGNTAYSLFIPPPPLVEILQPPKV